MVPYLICFLATGLLLFNFEKSKYKKTLIWIVVILLSLLAGFRSIDVGVDVRVYAYPNFLIAKDVHGSRQLSDFMFNSRFAQLEVEPGYLFVVFLGTKLFRGIFGPLFLTSLIINAGVLFGLYRIRDHLSFNIAAAIFCFMHYERTYNIMRQWMAMAVIIFGIKYIYDRKPLKYLLCVLAAMCFHQSAFIAVALYIIFVFMEKSRLKFTGVLVVGASVIGIMIFQPLVKSLISSGILTDKFLHYAEGDGVPLFLPEILVRLPAIAICSVMYKPMKQRDSHHPYWFVLMIVEAVISQLHGIMDFAARISAYFYIAQIVELSTVCTVGDRKQRTLIKLLVIAYAVLYWYVMYIYFGYSDTYPYMSQTLGIG